jgi:UDP-glucose-4-epimerase GalE
VTYDNLSTGHEWAVKWGPFVHGDLLDEIALNSVFERFQPIAVVHFAASALVGESIRDPGLYFRNNCVGSLQLIEVACRHGVDVLVFSSTCASYGIPGRVPISEDQAQCPINAYGASKLAVEHMLSHFDVAHGLRSVALRYFNAAGASPDLDLGEQHEPETHLIPLAIGAALGMRPPLEIFGMNYPTPDGTAIRDYVHVCDLANAHVAAVEYLLAGGRTMQLNLGTGTGLSVRQIMSYVEQEANLPVPYIEAARRLGDPAVLVADAQRARNELAWQPQFSSPEHIVKSALDWHRSLAARTSVDIRRDSIE